MAVAKVKKIHIAFSESSSYQIISEIQKFGKIHLLKSDDGFRNDKIGKDKFSAFRNETLASRIKKAEDTLSRLNQIIDILSHHEEKKNFLEKLVSLKQYITYEKFQQIKGFSFEEVYHSLMQTENKEHVIQKKIKKNLNLLSRLKYLNTFSHSLDDLRKMEYFSFCFIRFDKKDYKNVIEDLDQIFRENYHLEVIQNWKHQQVALVLSLKRKMEDLGQKLDKDRAQLIPVEDIHESPAELYEEIIRNLKKQQDELQSLTNGIGRFLHLLPDLYILSDFWANELQKYKKLQETLATSKVILISGWIKEQDVPAWDAYSQKFEHDMAWLVEEPTKDDLPPVAYENSAVIQPFEFVTDLYSRPKYLELDPTPFLALFFTIFFAICLTDAGYGIIMMILTGMFLKKVSFISTGTKKLVKLLFFSSIATVIAGIFTGGIFGLQPVQLPGQLRFLQNLVILNPMKNQMSFLVFTLILGIIHVGLGMLLNFYKNMVSKRYTEAWIDQMPWILILFGATVLAGAGFFNASWLSSVAKVILLLSALVIVMFAGRASKNIFVRFGIGIYTLYQVSGLFGDILSYARLFALGLATGVIAGVVNFLAHLTLGVPYVGYILMPIILIFGHLLNLLINALGGFIHTARLQYVEFFGKFYEGGGEPFEPFAYQLKYTKIKEQE